MTYFAVFPTFTKDCSLRSLNPTATPGIFKLKPFRDVRSSRSRNLVARSIGLEHSSSRPCLHVCLEMRLHVCLAIPCEPTFKSGVCPKTGASPSWVSKLPELKLSRPLQSARWPAQGSPGTQPGIRTLTRPSGPGGPIRPTEVKVVRVVRTGLGLTGCVLY